MSEQLKPPKRRTITNQQRRVFGVCSICNAQPGNPCRGVPAKSAHIARLQRASSFDTHPRHEDFYRNLAIMSIVEDHATNNTENIGHGTQEPRVGRPSKSGESIWALVKQFERKRSARWIQEAVKRSS